MHAQDLRAESAARSMQAAVPATAADTHGNSIKTNQNINKPARKTQNRCYCENHSSPDPSQPPAPQPPNGSRPEEARAERKPARPTSGIESLRPSNCPREQPLKNYPARRCRAAK